MVNDQLSDYMAVDVEISDSFDAILLRPRERAQESEFMRALRQALPTDARVARSAIGIRVDSDNAAVLLSGIPGISFRFDDEVHRYIENRNMASRRFTILRNELQSIVAGGASVARNQIADGRGKEVLDDHQAVNVATMTLKNGFGLCVFDEQGAGKTVSAIFAFDLLVSRKEVNRLLIVAPKSMISEWSRDFERFLPGAYNIMAVTGSARAKRAALRSEANVLVTNFETVVRLERNFRALLREQPGRTLLVVDESFLVKSPEAARTRSLRRLREWCGRAFVLCGTPAPNRPHDLVEQVNLVDFGLTFHGVSIPIDRDAAVPVVREAFEARALYVRHLKSRVLPDLPARSFHRFYVPLQPEQSLLYHRLHRRLVEEVKATTEIKFRRDYAGFLARRTALLQICSNPVAIAPDYRETPAKLLVLDELLNEWIQVRGEKVVLWSYYRRSVDELVNRYSCHGLVRYDGAVTDTITRGEAVRSFQEDSNVRLFVGNPAAAGAGLTLHSARLAIYESLSNQTAHYLQSLDRIHRRGQSRNVQYLILLCEDTVEVTEYERILKKQRVAGKLLSDPDEVAISRQTFLKSLSPLSTQSPTVR